MPGIVIHIACAKEYIRKHKNEIKNIDRFIKGTIEPDIASKKEGSSKRITHYENQGNDDIDLFKFVHDPKVNINDDFFKGYFFHLIVDDWFYNIFFADENNRREKNNDTFYNDCDYLNNWLISQYQIDVIEDIKESFKKGKKKSIYLDINKMKYFIEIVSNISLKKAIENIENDYVRGGDYEFRS